MVQLLNFVDREFDERSIYANKSNVWLYVDWSPELNGDTLETRRATTLEFYHAYREGAWLLRELGDIANADKYDHRAQEIRIGADKYLLDAAIADRLLRRLPEQELVRRGQLLGRPCRAQQRRAECASPEISHGPPRFVLPGPHVT